VTLWHGMNRKPDPVRLCQVCGKTMQRNRWKGGELEEYHRFIKRQTCSHECRYIQIARKRRIEPDKKLCMNCGAMFGRRRFSNGKLEDVSKFDRRYYCAECSKSHRVFTTKRDSFLARARKSRQYACSRCGSTKDLHIHHINGIPFDNDLTNLITLCKRCHLDHHWGHATESLCLYCGVIIKTKHVRRDKHCSVSCAMKDRWKNRKSRDGKLVGAKP